MDNTFEGRHLTRRYGKNRVLTDVTLTAVKGTCVGIAGRNGIGKSTLFRILAGVDRPDSGRLTLFGRDLLKDRSAFGELIGYVPQTNPLLEELTVRDNLRLWSGHPVTGDEETVRALELQDILKTRVSRLSGGMKRRLAIACALANEPPVLIMDEPTAALDLYHRGIIYDYLDAFRARGGMIILSTHDIEEMQFSDRLYLIRDGAAEEATVEAAAAAIRRSKEIRR